MKTVYLHGKLGKRFGRKWELDVGSLHEVLSAIEANSEGFISYIIESNSKGQPYAVFNKSPEKISSEKDFNESIIDSESLALLSQTNEVHLVSCAQGSVFTAIGAIAGLVYSAGAALLSGSFLAKMALSVVIGLVMQAITKPPDPPKRKDPVSTKSFLMAGASTRQAQGIAVPLGYGKLKVGATNVATRKTSRKLSSSKKADTLESFSEMEFVDLISEGPIQGFVDKNGSILQSKDIMEAIYLNDVQVKNTPESFNDADSYNYIINENYTSSTGRPRYKLGYENAETVLSEGVFYMKEYDTLLYGPKPYVKSNFRGDIQGAINNKAKIASHFVYNFAVNEITISLKGEISNQADDGGVNQESVDFAILVINQEGEYNVLDNRSGCSIKSMGAGLRTYAPGGSWGKKQTTQSYFTLTGIATSSYQFDIKISIDRDGHPKEMKSGLTFKVIKLSPELDPSVKGGDYGGISKRRALQLSHVEEKISENLLYPHSAMIKLMIDSKNFSNVPERSYHVKLKKVLIPSNYDPISRKYNGAWNGLFKGQSNSLESIHSISDDNKYWTDNPAWVFFDLLYNPRYGVGKYGLEEENIDKWQIYKIAKYCDELVETDYPIETATGLPRRFITNNEINDSTNPDSFQINLYLEHDGFTDDEGKVVSRATGITDQQFKDEFGEDNSFKGRKICFFIYEPSGDIIDENEIGFRSSVREGKIRLEERIIVSSDPYSRSIIVSGPSLSPSNWTEQKTIGACATQINHPIVEPRFSANLYLTDRAEAFEIIKNLASIFRGMSAYSGGKILAVQDSLKKPVQLFNNSNVSSSGFSYSGVDKSKRITASMVRFNNESKNYKPDLVYEEDPDAIQKFGYLENETMGLGITSESQARRLAQWILLTSQLETETVKFVTGQEASYLFPGCVFEISDENRVGGNKSGRLLGIYQRRELSLNGQNDYVDNPYLLLDKPIESSASVSFVEITVCVGTSNSTYDIIEARAPSETSQETQDQEIDDMLTPQMYRFQAMIGMYFGDKNKGPQGQRTIAYNLLLKSEFSVDLKTNKIKKTNHGLIFGERIVFKTNGVLPTGLSANKVYYVINPAPHTFQVSLSEGGNAVNILDIGKDELLSSGGEHFFCEYSEGYLTGSKTQEALDQLSIGAPYSINGLVGVKSDYGLNSLDLVNNLKLSNESASGWVNSDIFGSVFIEKNDGWIFSVQINEWIYVKNIINSGLQDGGWFYSNLLGWVEIREAGDDYFWYINDLNESFFSKKNGLYFYRYEEDMDTINNSGVFLIGEKKCYIKNIILDSGFYFSFIEASSDFELTSPPVNPVLRENISNPGFYENEIFEMFHINQNDSIQGKESIRLTFSGYVSDLNFKKNTQLNIKDFSSDNPQLDEFMNNTIWDTAYVNLNTVELLESQSVALLFKESEIFSVGSIAFSKRPESLVDRNVSKQMFRLLSVKETADNSYEVVGLEYNASKFNSVDKKGVIKKPFLPIPPQADMELPDAPTRLILNSLS